MKKIFLFLGLTFAITTLHAVSSLADADKFDCRDNGGNLQVNIDDTVLLIPRQKSGMWGIVVETITSDKKEYILSESEKGCVEIGAKPIENPRKVQYSLPGTFFLDSNWHREIEYNSIQFRIKRSSQFSEPMFPLNHSCLSIKGDYECSLGFTYNKDIRVSLQMIGGPSLSRVEFDDVIRKTRAYLKSLERTTLIH